MLKYYQQNISKAGTGLECLPGVKQLLQALKVDMLMQPLPEHPIKII